MILFRDKTNQSVNKVNVDTIMCLTNDIFFRVKVLQNYDLNLIVAILKGTGSKKKKDKLEYNYQIYRIF